MNILSYNSENEALNGAKECWIKIIKDTVSESIKTVKNGQIYTNLDGVSDETISTLKVCGEKYGETQLSNGLTTEYAIVVKAYDVNKWYFLEPESKYLPDTSGYTSQTLPSEWIPPIP